MSSEKQQEKRATTLGDAALAVGGSAVVGGAGAFAVQAVRNALRRRSQGGIKRQSPPPRSSRSVPVEVTPEEAEELERQGVKVKLARSENYWQAFGRHVGNNALKWVGGGAALAAGGYGGWQLGRLAFGGLERRAQKQRNRRMRERIRSLLDEEEEDQDQKLAAYLRAGVDHYLHKRASVLGLTGGALGIAGVASLISASHRAAPTADPKVKSMKQWVQRERKPQLSQLRLQPVLRVSKREDEEEEEAGGPSDQAVDLAR